MRPARKPAPPLDSSALQALALRYVERFATSRGRLIRYLTGKVRLRGWSGEGEPDLEAIAEKLVRLGYVNDEIFAEARTRSLSARGYGGRRVGQALAAAGIEKPLAARMAATLDGPAAALAYARRRRFGRFAAVPPDVDTARRQLAAMLRAGHSFADARAALALDIDEDGGF